MGGSVKRSATLAAALVLLFCCLCVAEAEAFQQGVVAKVTTGKGPLKLRAGASASAAVRTEIPNGTCILVTEETDVWCCVTYEGQSGYCMTKFLTLLREANPDLLNYRILRMGATGDDVLAVKRRLQELGYIRSGSELTNVYNDILTERIVLFQHQSGMTEDGIASQELQAYLFSDKAPECNQTLPNVRSRVFSKNIENRVICGCCFGEGCECCGFTGWIRY